MLGRNGTPIPLAGKGAFSSSHQMICAPRGVLAGDFGGELSLNVAVFELLF